MLVAILSLTIGAVKISRQQTLIQRVNAVESLANATVLCFDKTGTLTQNKLSVREIIEIADVESGVIQRDLFTFLKNLAHLNNTAQAIERYIDQDQVSAGDYPQKLREIPFTSGRKWAAVCLAEKTLLWARRNACCRPSTPGITMPNRWRAMACACWLSRRCPAIPI